MKYLFAGIILISLTSFSLFKSKWIKTKKDIIVLYTRPESFTNYLSPDSSRINKYLKEGILCVNEINKVLEVNFNSKIKVYLYNYDEAKEQIGTNAGGGAIPTEKIILYTYTKDNYIDKKRNRVRYVGVHEYVHIVSFNTIGISKTRLFTEGYATAIDGSYGGKEIESFLKKDNIKTPTELLNGEEMFEGDFYPQAGFFIKWLFNEYSVKKSNKLFILTNDEIKNEFENITGDSYLKMEKKYIEFCNKYLENSNLH